MSESTPGGAAVSNRPVRRGWIFSPTTDALVFAGPVAAAALIAWVFHLHGELHADVPVWVFVVLVIGCDVAHVWSTLFRTYLDPAERARRGRLFTIVPAACFAIGAAIHGAFGADVFWRVLAYVAVFHFVRQQYGWMRYAGRKGPPLGAVDRRLDAAAIYAATVGPIVWWHAHLPRQFVWFREGDFVVGLPGGIAELAIALHAVVLVVWLARQAQLMRRGTPLNAGKALVLVTTWMTWYGGIVWLDSDIAFTASNVLAHGVPYFVLVHRFGRSRWLSGDSRPQRKAWQASLFRPTGVLMFYAALFALAFAEEGLWNAFVWHEYAGLFGLPFIEIGDAATIVAVAALATPQATHYVLDAWIWRTDPRENPDLVGHLGLAASAANSP